MRMSWPTWPLTAPGTPDCWVISASCASVWQSARYDWGVLIGLLLLQDLREPFAALLRVLEHLEWVAQASPRRPAHGARAVREEEFLVAVADRLRAREVL